MAKKGEKGQFYGNESKRTSEMRKKLRTYASKKGGSMASVAKACGMSAAALSLWIKDEPKFGVTMERCLARGNEREKGKIGNPTKLTDEVRVMLKHVAAIDGSVEEMACYCNVSRQTIYNWFKEDAELFDEIERLRHKPVLAARQRLVLDIRTPEGARFYATKNKRMRDDFGDHSSIDVKNLTDDKEKIKQKTSLLDTVLGRRKGSS